MTKPTEMSEQEFAYHAYGFICTPSEVERILTPKTAQDVLLRMRADAVIDHARLYRVMHARKRRHGQTWSFEGHFNTREIEAVLSQLPSGVRESCEVAAGFTFSDDPNGACTRTEFGNVIVVSESLRYFLYFMNLAFLGFGVDIPDGVRISALTIGIRTMLQTEAMDFELDPRGSVPPDIHRHIDLYTERQLEFVIGHEFAHHALGHVSSAAIEQRTLFARASNCGSDRMAFYNYSQEQEFDADKWSLDVPVRSAKEQAFYALSAVLFFTYIDIFEQVREQILPSTRRFKTHPPPFVRRSRILNGGTNLSHFDIAGLLELSENYKSGLQEHAATNVEVFETYGSVYLDVWRGAVLVDRVDY